MKDFLENKKNLIIVSAIALVAIVAIVCLIVVKPKTEKNAKKETKTESTIKKPTVSDKDDMEQEDKTYGELEMEEIIEGGLNHVGGEVNLGDKSNATEFPNDIDGEEGSGTTDNTPGEDSGNKNPDNGDSNGNTDAETGNKYGTIY